MTGRGSRSILEGRFGHCSRYLSDSLLMKLNIIETPGIAMQVLPKATLTPFVLPSSVCSAIILPFSFHADQDSIKKLPITTHHSIWLSFLFQLDRHFLSFVPFYRCL